MGRALSHVQSPVTGWLARIGLSETCSLSFKEREMGVRVTR